MIFSESEPINTFFEIVTEAYDAKGIVISVMPYKYRWVIFGIAMVNLVINVSFEIFLLPVLVKIFRKLYKK